MAHRGDRALVERPGGPGADGGREQHLEPEAGAMPTGCSRPACPGASVAHDQHERAEGERHGDPEAAPHVELRARPLLDRGDARLERHAADRAAAGRVAHDLGVHRTGPLGLGGRSGAAPPARAPCRTSGRLRVGRSRPRGASGRSTSFHPPAPALPAGRASSRNTPRARSPSRTPRAACRGGRRRCPEVLHRLGVELRFAARRAEVDNRPGMLGAVLRGRRVDGHSADRVDDVGASAGLCNWSGPWCWW